MYIHTGACVCIYVYCIYKLTNYIFVSFYGGKKSSKPGQIPNDTVSLTYILLSQKRSSETSADLR